MDHFIPFSNVPSSENTNITFMTSIFRLHGLSNKILSHRGTQFTFKFWSSICKTIKISIKLSSPFHHHINSLTERVIFILNNFSNVIQILKDQIGIIIYSFPNSAITIQFKNS